MNQQIQETTSQRLALQIGSMTLDILRLQATVEYEVARANAAEARIAKLTENSAKPADPDKVAAKK